MLNMLEILIFAAIASFFIIKLNSVLGRRTGSEKKPKFDLFGTGEEGPVEAGQAATLPEDKVVRITKHTQLLEKYKQFAPVFEEFTRIDMQFDLHHFLEGAKNAFSMVISAYNDNDQQVLKRILSKELFAKFIESLSQANQRPKIELLSFLTADIIDAQLKKGHWGEITLKFITEQTEIPNGPRANLRTPLSRIVDIWVFERDLRSKDPNWILMATKQPS